MVRAKLGPKRRPPQTLYIPDHGLSFWGGKASDRGLSLGRFWGRGRRGGSHFLGSEKGVFGKGVFSKIVHFQEILENVENLEILETPQSVGKQRRVRPFTRDSRESGGDFRDSRDSSSERPLLRLTVGSLPPLLGRRRQIRFQKSVQSHLSLPPLSLFSYHGMYCICFLAFHI